MPYAKTRDQIRLVNDFASSAHRNGFADKTLAGDSILSIEFLFQDTDLPAWLISKKRRPLGGDTPFVKEGKKQEFAERAKSLPRESFVAFEPIFERWNDIREGRL